MRRRITEPRMGVLLPVVLAAALLLACGDPQRTTPDYSGPAQQTPVAVELPAQAPASVLAGAA